MMGDDDVLIRTWRTHKEQMQFISGALGKQKIHFEATPSDAVPNKMAHFIHWFNWSSSSGKHPFKKRIMLLAIAFVF